MAGVLKGLREAPTSDRSPQQASFGLCWCQDGRSQGKGSRTPTRAGLSRTGWLALKRPLPPQASCSVQWRGDGAQPPHTPCLHLHSWPLPPHTGGPGPGCFPCSPRSGLRGTHPTGNPGGAACPTLPTCFLSRLHFLIYCGWRGAGLEPPGRQPPLLSSPCRPVLPRPLASTLSSCSQVPRPWPPNAAPPTSLLTPCFSFLVARAHSETHMVYVSSLSSPAACFACHRGLEGQLGKAGGRTWPSTGPHWAQAGAGAGQGEQQDSGSPEGAADTLPGRLRVGVEEPRQVRGE